VEVILDLVIKLKLVISKIIEELNKYDNVYILIKEGNQFFEYGVNYRFNRLNK